MRGLRVAALALLVCVSPFPARAGFQDPQALSSQSAERQVVLGNKTLRYRASYSELVLKSGAGVPQATISATSYVVQGATDRARPIIFAFNGGPGASSSPLQFSVMGPRIRAESGGGMVDNAQSPLDLADLVFIDPVGTGFSRVLPGGSGKPFWSIDGDAAAVGQLIHAWLRQNGREGTPVYIAGESYGGTRLMALLPLVSNLNLAGVLMISPALDMPSDDSDLGAALTLPSLAVAAVQNGKVPARGRSIPQIFEEARVFATGRYASALFKGSAIAPDEEADVARQLSALIGLPVEDLIASHLRVDVETYRRSLRKNDGLVVGRLDSRVVAPIPTSSPNRPSAANDPALGLGKSNVILSAPITSYFRQELGFTAPLDYVSLTLDVNFQWIWPPVQGRGAATGLTKNLADAMQAHPKLQAVLIGGYYDLAVPVLLPRYAIDHAWLPANRIRLVARESGHSVFENPDGRREMKSLVAQLLGNNRGTN